MGVITGNLVTERMLAEFVDDFGGHWFTEGQVPSGTIERGVSAVYVYIPKPVNFTLFDSQQIRDLRELITAEPMSYIELGLSRDEASDNLGYQVARAIINRWGGVIEKGDGSFVQPVADG